MQIANKKNLTEVMLVLSVYAFVSLYLLPSGFVQLVDLAIVALFIRNLNTITIGEFRDAFRFVAPFMPLLAWSLIVNAYYTIMRGDRISFMFSSVEIIYTLAILFFLLVSLKRLLRNPKNIDYILYFIIISCILTAALPNDISHWSDRSYLSFNNPLQLAYYGILILMSLFLLNYLAMKLAPAKPLHFMISIGIMLVANLFVFITASRAGLVSCLVMDLILFILFLKEYKLPVLIAVTVLGIASGIYVNFSNSSRPLSIDNAIKRFTTKQMVDTTDLYQRTFGYVNFKDTYAIVFGNGGRFNPESGVRYGKVFYKEVHNSILGITLAYGIVGGVLFLAGAAGFLVQIKLPYKFVLILPLAMYNMTEYGLRFRFLWITLALLAAVSLITSAESRHTEPVRPSILPLGPLHFPEKEPA